MFKRNNFVQTFGFRDEIIATLMLTWNNHIEIAEYYRMQHSIT